jgi:hypothetical protein
MFSNRLARAVEFDRQLTELAALGATPAEVEAASAAALVSLLPFGVLGTIRCRMLDGESVSEILDISVGMPIPTNSRLN